MKIHRKCWRQFVCKIPALARASERGMGSGRGTDWGGRWHDGRVIGFTVRQTAGWNIEWVSLNRVCVCDQSHTKQLWAYVATVGHCSDGGLQDGEGLCPHSFFFSVSPSVIETDGLRTSGSGSYIPSPPRGTWGKKWLVNMHYGMLTCLEGMLWLTMRPADSHTPCCPD